MDDIPFIAALLVTWVASDAREARAIDAALVMKELRGWFEGALAERPPQARPLYRAWRAGPGAGAEGATASSSRA